MELSEKERLVLYNQYEIMKILNAEDEHEIKTCELNQEILLNGYVHDYDSLLEGFSDETPPSISKFVLDVLQMYRSLLVSYNKLQQVEKDEIMFSDIKFKGFDGNEETPYFVYCEFVLEKLGAYSEIYEKGHCETNSHHPVIDSYKKMIASWESVAARYDDLSKDQIVKIIKSR